MKPDQNKRKIERSNTNSRREAPSAGKMEQISDNRRRR
jgi:hypothetical protein